MYSLYSLNTLNSIIERIDLKELNLDKIITILPHEELIKEVKEVLGTFVTKRKEIHELKLLFELLIYHIHRNALFREGIMLVIKGILIEFIQESSGILYDKEETARIVESIRGSDERIEMSMVKHLPNIFGYEIKIHEKGKEVVSMKPDL